MINGNIVLCDISRHNGKVDFVKMKSAGADGVVIRGSMGEGGVDERWAENYAGAKSAGLLVGMYHLFFPELSQPGQVANIKLQTQNRPLDFPIVLDAEMTRSCTPAQITAGLLYVARNTPRVRGRNPMIYTRSTWWRVNVLPRAEWEQYPLWIAMYNDSVYHPWTGQPAGYHPRDWERWQLWQYSADGNGRGPEFGGGSTSMDLSRFNGTPAEFGRWLGLDAPAPEPVPAPDPGERMRVTVNSLRLRNAPNLLGAVIGSLPQDEIVEILDRPIVWVKVRRSNGQVGYAAQTYGGETYLEQAG
ncbi:MAG TPA: GH25 family lysozyme [Bellilinea sp.]|nr:GH25 family lysozyme [Bellilinea sp.]